MTVSLWGEDMAGPSPVLVSVREDHDFVEFMFEHLVQWHDRYSG